MWKRVKYIIKTHTSIGRVVVGVGSNEGASVKRARDYKLDFANPFLDCFSLGLRLFRVRFEVIREVAVQVVAPGVVSGVIQYIFVMHLPRRSHHKLLSTPLISCLMAYIDFARDLATLFSFIDKIFSFFLTLISRYLCATCISWLMIILFFMNYLNCKLLNKINRCLILYVGIKYVPKYFIF